MNMDQAILMAFPLLVVPRLGAIPTAENSGVRFVVGRAGIWREVNLPWVRARHLIADAQMELPYGDTSEGVELLCGDIPTAAIKQFHEEAKAAAPTEIAAAILWNEETGGWRYARRPALSAGVDHILFKEVAIGEGEHLVVDVHSHGHHPAFFSPMDDADDHGTMRLSLVLGDLHQDTPSSAMRLCLAGLVRPAVMTAGGAVEVSL